MKYVFFVIFFCVMSMYADDYFKALKGPEGILALYQLFKDVDQILRDHNINYFVHAGTLLGAVRHGGIIPWDDDVDIVILEEEENAFRCVCPLLDQYGYWTVEWSYFGYKIWYKEAPEPTWIDVMVFRNNNGVYEYKNTDFWAYPFAKFEQEDLFPLKDYQFGDFFVKGPQNPYPYLARVYKKWKDIASYYINHNYILDFAYISDKTMHCAMPTGPLKPLGKA